jgi:hypothetical protein
MADRLVTVASYAFMPEAQMAKNLLASEGIAAYLAGEMTANTLIAAGEAHLQVHAEDAQRAVRLLAAAQASLPDDWEESAERGLWTCPVCGTAVTLGENVCPACQTSNPAITTDARALWGPAGPAAGQGVTGSDQIQADPPRPAPGPAGGEPAAKAGPGCGLLLLAAAAVGLGLLWG